MSTTAYRYPGEHLILAITMILVIAVIALTATATVCLSIFFVLGMVLLSYNFSRAHHQSLLRQAQPVNEINTQLVSLVKETAFRLQVEPVEVFIAPSRQLNAYTFGLSKPKSIVLHSALFQVMDGDELQFILGHEMGHVILGHTWLNSLVGGLAGIPSPPEASLLLVLAFRWWNRACEYSSDRAGLLACGKPQKAISALVKLETFGNRMSQAGYQQAASGFLPGQDGYRENDWASQLNELFATHPAMARRVKHLDDYAKSTDYLRLQDIIDRQVPPDPFSPADQGRYR